MAGLGHKSKSLRLVLVFVFGLFVVACESMSLFEKSASELSPEEAAERAAKLERDREWEQRTSNSVDGDEFAVDDSFIFKKERNSGSSGGLASLFGNKEDSEGGANFIEGVGVNSYLWRATLDTISFMPLSSADPFGGVILTDWHANPDAPGERFKLNIRILGRALRADGINVSMFRQVQDRTGSWINAVIPRVTNEKIENAILFKARELRNRSKRY